MLTLYLLLSFLSSIFFYCWLASLIVLRIFSSFTFPLLSFLLPLPLFFSTFLYNSFPPTLLTSPPPLLLLLYLLSCSFITSLTPLMFLFSIIFLHSNPPFILVCLYAAIITPSCFPSPLFPFSFSCLLFIPVLISGLLILSALLPHVPLPTFLFLNLFLLPLLRMLITHCCHLLLVYSLPLFSSSPSPYLSFPYSFPPSSLTKVYLLFLS